MTDQDTSAISVRELDVRFGRTLERNEKQALSGLSLEIKRRSFCGLVGRTGAGKTTLLRALVGLEKTQSGEALIFGKNFAKSTPKERARVAYVSQEAELPPFQVEDLTLLLASQYPTWDEREFDRLRERFAPHRG